MESKRSLVKAIRCLEKDLATLRALAVPYTGKYYLMRRKEIPTVVHHVTSMSHYVKHLAIHKEIQSSDIEKGLERTIHFILEVAENLERHLENERSLEKLGNIQELMEESSGSPRWESLSFIEP